MEKEHRCVWAMGPRSSVSRKDADPISRSIWSRDLELGCFLWDTHLRYPAETIQEAFCLPVTYFQTSGAILRMHVSVGSTGSIWCYCSFQFLLVCVFVCLGCMFVCGASVTGFSYLKTGSQFELWIQWWHYTQVCSGSIDLALFMRFIFFMNQDNNKWREVCMSVLWLFIACSFESQRLSCLNNTFQSVDIIVW